MNKAESSERLIGGWSVAPPVDRDTGNWVCRGKQSSGSRPAKRATTYLPSTYLPVTCYLPNFITYLLFASDHFYDIRKYIMANALPNEPLLTYYY